MWEAIRANKRKSVILISLMGVLLAALGASIGGALFGAEDPRPMLFGALVAGAIWLLLTIAALYQGRNILLALSGAREVKHSDAPQLYNIVEEMRIAASLPETPKVFIMEERAPNAFAVGTPDNAAVAVTTGLLSVLSRDELQGVIAHEIGHIKNQDSNFMTIAGVMLGTIVIIADLFTRTVFYGAMFGGRRRSRSDSGGGAQMLIFLIAILLAVLAPILAQLLYFACSRSREYLADACSAVFTRYPEGLASALEKISGVKVPLYAANRVTAPMYIVPPIMKAQDDDATPTAILSTHPPTVERIKILRSMGTKIGFASYNSACENVKGKGVIGASTLRSAEELEMRGIKPEERGVDVRRQTREATDILHKLNGLLFLDCQCGLKLKIPPTFSRDEIKCPRCGAIHNLAELKKNISSERNG